MRNLFLWMDKDRNNTIDYRELLNALAPPPSAERAAEIGRVFALLDADGDGYADLTDVGRCYAPANHPSVAAGEAAAGDVLSEFLASLDEAAVMDKASGRLDEAGLREYYRLALAFVDDAQFAELMRRVWQKPPGAPPAGAAGRAKPVSLGQVSRKGEYGEKPGPADALRRSRELPLGARNVSDLLAKLKAELARRGVRGIVGLGRRFRAADDDGSRALSRAEFEKARGALARVPRARRFLSRTKP